MEEKMNEMRHLRLLWRFSVRLSGAKRTPCCCTYSATPRKSTISCDPETELGYLKDPAYSPAQAVR